MIIDYSTEALWDLADIINYGEGRFGADQTAIYVTRLKNSLELISRHPELGPKRHINSRDVRVHPVGSHLIVYEILDSAIRLVRFLPARQNLADHI